jgi:pimeloyl-ACP methyl ester carboxylesterase
MKIFISIWALILFSGCASHLPKQIDTINPNQSVEYLYIPQEGNSTVIFENGLGATYDYWDKVIPEVSKSATVFAYNRAGYGESKNIFTPRDGETIINELRSILSKKGINPPYVLVGHSLGGLYFQYYARRYPHEVKALVLVDSTHPNQLKGNGSYDHWPWWYSGLFDLFASETVKRELDAVNMVGEEVLALPSPDIPIIILSSSESSILLPELAKDAYEKRKDMINLYPNAKQIWVDCGHGIQIERPEVVIEAIKKVTE